jgi:hypothetical protein
MSLLEMREHCVSRSRAIASGDRVCDRLMASSHHAQPLRERRLPKLSGRALEKISANAGVKRLLNKDERSVARELGNSAVKKKVTIVESLDVATDAKALQELVERRGLLHFSRSV